MFYQIFLLNKFYMFITRPSTAYREIRTSKAESKNFAGSKRPATAENTSLRKIIQIIENTLSIGSKTQANKSKIKFKSITNKQNLLTQYSLSLKQNKEKLSKTIKTQVEYAVPQKQDLNHIFPKQRGSTHHSQFDKFLPYKKQFTHKTQCFIGKSGKQINFGKPLKKISRKKVLNPQYKSIKLNDEINEWENPSTVQNMSKLFENAFP